MDDLMTGINTSGGMDDIGSMPQHSLPSTQSVYDPSAVPAEPAAMTGGGTDDLNDVLAQMNNAFGHLGSETVHQAAPQPAQQPVRQSPQPTGMGQSAQPMGMGQSAQQMGMGQPARPMGMGQSVQPMGMGQPAQPMGMGQSVQPMGMGQPAQQMGMGQPAQQPVRQPVQPMGMGQSAQQMGMGQFPQPTGQQEQPVRTNDSGYTSDDYKYDPRRMNYGQQFTGYGNPPQRSSSSYGMQDPYNSTGYGGYSTASYRSEGGEFSAILMGVLGAVIGAIPGMLLMIFVARFGFIASLCGAAMAAMIFGGYKLMTKNSLLSTKTGLIICGAVMALAVFLAVRISWTFALRDALGLAKAWLGDLDDYGFTDSYYKGLIGDEEPTFGNCWSNFSAILTELGYKGRFIASLAENYLFAGLGCAGVFAKFGRNY